jgi:glucose-6-phosphate 1-dehydrogenase
VPSDEHVIMLFGATGDLARRKLLPGLFHLAKAGLLPPRYRIIGSARSTLTDDEFRRRAKKAVAEFGLAKPTGQAWREFANSLSYGAATQTQPQPLLDAVAAAERRSASPSSAPRRSICCTRPPSR